MPQAQDPPKFTGTVTEVEVESTGERGSELLQFMVTPAAGQGDSQIFVVQSEAPPRTFAAMAALLAAAYAGKLVVIVTYTSGDPPQAINVKLTSLPERPPGRMGFM